MDKYCWTKVKECGNVIEMVSMKCYSEDNCHCIKINSDFYYDNRTGEVKEYIKSENKSECVQSVRRTLERVRNIINCNVLEPKNCKFVTLTYAENMTDTEKLYVDMDKFWKKMLRWFRKNNIETPEYINIIEPQGRGAWHSHCIWIWSDAAPFVANSVVAEKWGQGFTSTKKVVSCDNVGAYFSAYLADMPLEEFEKLSDEERSRIADCSERTIEKQIDDDGKKLNKRFVKGARLYMYPSNMNILRTSRGIKRPVETVTTLGKAEKKVSAATETFSISYEIVDDNDKVINKIVKKYYNTKRKKSQE